MRDNDTICGADCGGCGFKDSCIAAEYIKTGGREAYEEFKRRLLREVNELLSANDMPPADKLCELPGSFVDLAYAYPLPSGKEVRFLDPSKVYLGAQTGSPELGVCCGVVADTSFILICSYGIDGSLPELAAYKRR